MHTYMYWRNMRLTCALFCTESVGLCACQHHAASNIVQTAGQVMLYHSSACLARGFGWAENSVGRWHYLITIGRSAQCGSRSQLSQNQHVTPRWVEKTCLKAANGEVWQQSLRVRWQSFDDKVQEFNSEVWQWSLEVFLHYWRSLTVRAHYSRSSTAFWCQWWTLAKFTHHFQSPKVIFEVHWQSFMKLIHGSSKFQSSSKSISIFVHFQSSMQSSTAFKVAAFLFDDHKPGSMNISRAVTTLSRH